MQKVNEALSANIGNYLTNYKSWNPVAYNVLEYGLKGAPTEDTQALQKLVDLAISEGRKAIYFPHGQYYVTSLTNADQVVFFGDNASFTGGYTGTIHQMGDWATNAQLADIAISVKSYGAKGDGVTNDVNAIKKAIEAVPPGGVLLFPNCDDFYLVDQSYGPVFIIDKPMTIQGDIKSLIKIKDQSNLWHQGGRTSLFYVTSSDVVFDGLQIDGNSKNNWVMEGNKKIFYAVEEDSIYPTGVTLIEYKAGVKESTITGAIVENCTFYYSSGATVVMAGSWGASDRPITANDRENSVLKPIIRNNTVYGGQRSILNFIYGVIGGKMENNNGIDIYYHLCRQYLQCVDCVADNNEIFINTTLDDGATYESQTNGVPRTPINIGIRIGHDNRGPGTVNNASVINNRIYAHGNGEWRAQVGISVASGVDNFLVKDNLIFGPTLTTGIDLHAGVKSGMVVGNTVVNLGRSTSGNIGIAVRENEGRIEIINNSFKSPKFLRGIQFGVGSTLLHVVNNVFQDDGGGSGAWAHSTFSNSYFSQNYYNGAQLTFSDLVNGVPSNQLLFQNVEDYTFGQPKARGISYIAKRLGVPSQATVGYFVVLERLSQSGGVGFTQGQIYGHRSDAGDREFIINIQSNSVTGGNHVARIDYVATSRNVAKLVKLTFGGVDYLAVKIGGTVANDPRTFGVFFTGQHSSNGESLFIVSSTQTHTETDINTNPVNGWVYGGRPGDAIGNNRALYVAGTGTAIACEVDSNGFVKVIP